MGQDHSDTSQQRQHLMNKCNMSGRTSQRSGIAHPLCTGTKRGEGRHMPGEGEGPPLVQLVAPKQCVQLKALMNPNGVFTHSHCSTIQLPTPQCGASQGPFMWRAFRTARPHHQIHYEIRVDKNVRENKMIFVCL